MKKVRTQVHPSIRVLRSCMQYLECEYLKLSITTPGRNETQMIFRVVTCLYCLSLQTSYKKRSLSSLQTRGRNETQMIFSLARSS